MSVAATRPSLVPPPPWRFPRPRRATLDNGIEVMVYDLPGQYVLAAHLVLDLPLTSEDRAREGVATICARSLDEGTARHGGEEFAELLETEGAGFGVDVSLSGVQTVLDVPASRLPRALDLFAEAVTEPALADTDATRHVQLRLAEIEQAQTNPAQAASIAFRSAVFDSRFRASRMSAGEADTVRTVGPGDVRDYYLRWFGPARTTLILAGDFGPADPTALAEQAFGGWRNESQAAAAQETPAGQPPRAVLIDRPGAVQADLRLGGFGIDRNDPRWADLTIAGYAMGGGFLSRLNAVLREERGYTYGVRFNATPLRSGGFYAVQGSFRTEVLGAALTEARQLLDISGAPFRAEEVSDAIAFFRGVSPLRYATADGVADQAATQVLMGLPEDFVDTSLADLERVTPESASAAYASLVDLERLTLVVAGDAEKLAQPIREAGYPQLDVIGPT